MSSGNGLVAGTPEVVQTPAYLRAVEFMRTVEAREGIDYKWVLDYAKGLWDYRNKTFAVLDDKAEAIIKYLGGGTGLFTFGVLAKVDSANVHLAAASVPAIVLALVAIYYALRSKKPAPFPGIPTIEAAKGYADEFKTESAALAAFLGQWNLACEEARLVCNLKANAVERAMRFTYGSIVALLLPLLLGLLLPPAH